MRLQKCPNSWSCLPTAYAIFLDRPVGEIIDFIGHDGSYVKHPEYDPPFNRRGFHNFECIAYALSVGYSVTPIMKFEYYMKESNVHRIANNDFDWYLTQYSGILCGQAPGSAIPHAVAYDHKLGLVYDPMTVKSYAVDKFYPDELWTINLLK